MVFHFLVLSGENEDFVREILIDSNCTFLDFHKAIQDSVGYDAGQLASFFISDEEWEKGLEVTMMKMDEQAGSLLMEDVKLGDHLENVKDRLIYTFDFFGNRGFFVEVLGVATEGEVKEPRCVRSEADAPEQIMITDLEDGSLDIFDLGDEDDDLLHGFEEVSLDELDEEW